MSGNENERGGLKKPAQDRRKKSYYGGKCDVRLSAEEDSMLSRLASDNGVTRSDIMRRALKDFFKFNTDEE